jgi:hypothetical protein
MRLIIPYEEGKRAKVGKDFSVDFSLAPTFPPLLSKPSMGKADPSTTSGKLALLGFLEYGFEVLPRVYLANLLRNP